MSRNIPQAELEVLKVLWDLEDATIRQITERLYPGGGTSCYATVQKLLERLEAKACVARRPVGRAHEFRAVVDRETLIDEQLRATAERLCDGSLTPLVARLLGDAQLAPGELDELRELVDRLERESE